ncbi:hypothetical protein LY78DRAFT_693719 [Colletotrichum sublineola]|nr:hypothetical protein LY78DRAFT_693719 [Colletotrichum sublineola]
MLETTLAKLNALASLEKPAGTIFSTHSFATFCHSTEAWGLSNRLNDRPDNKKKRRPFSYTSADASHNQEQRRDNPDSCSRSGSNNTEERRNNSDHDGNEGDDNHKHRTDKAG